MSDVWMYLLYKNKNKCKKSGTRPTIVLVFKSNLEKDTEWALKINSSVSDPALDPH
jgi:hypothetical protein